MTQDRRPFAPCLVCLALVAVALPSASAQSPARRLELSDTTRSASRAEPPHPGAVSRAPAPANPERPVAPAKRGESVLHQSFIRDQAALGLLVYGPSFAAAVTGNAVAWAATYVVVGGGTYFVASQLSRDLAINEPTSWFATQAAVRGGLSGWAIAYGTGADRRTRAGAIFLGSIGFAAGAVALGRGMSDGEVAASVFGADLTALGGLAATHIAGPSAGTRARAGITAAAGLLGYPLGYWYARRASYHVSAGDVNTLWTGAAVGATAASAFIANGRPSARTVAATLTAGALAGTILDDRLLVRRRDHSPEDGQMVVLGAVAGGMMGAGLGILSGAAHDRVSAATAALTVAGAVGGIVLAERWRGTSGDAGRKLGGLELDPAGVIAVAAGATGTHTLLHWTF